MNDLEMINRDINALKSVPDRTPEQNEMLYYLVQTRIHRLCWGGKNRPIRSIRR
jgi:hypothetical protein